MVAFNDAGIRQQAQGGQFPINLLVFEIQSRLCFGLGTGGWRRGFACCGLHDAARLFDHGLRQDRRRGDFWRGLGQGQGGVFDQGFLERGLCRGGWDRAKIGLGGGVGVHLGGRGTGGGCQRWFAAHALIGGVQDQWVRATTAPLCHRQMGRGHNAGCAAGALAHHVCDFGLDAVVGGQVIEPAVIFGQVGKGRGGAFVGPANDAGQPA